MNVLLFTLMIATINQIVKVKYISQKLLLIRFNSFIATDFRFGFSFVFSFGSDFIFLKFELQFLDRILVRILDLFFYSVVLVTFLLIILC